MARMTGFVFQDEYLERLAKLSDQEVGRLVRALAEYHATGKDQELAGREGVAFDFIKVDIDRIDQKYEARCETNRSNRQQTMTNDNNRQPSSTIVNKPQPTATNSDQTRQDKVKDKDKYIKETPLTGSKEKAAALDRAFDKFWACYPRREGKQMAKKSFMKIAPDDDLLETMLVAIQRQKQTDQWSDPRYIPHPATWLNGRRWEDEPAQPRSGGKTVAANSYAQRDYSEEKLEAQLGLNDLYRAEASG